MATVAAGSDAEVIVLSSDSEDDNIPAVPSGRREGERPHSREDIIVQRPKRRRRMGTRPGGTSLFPAVNLEREEGEEVTDDLEDDKGDAVLVRIVRPPHPPRESRPLPHIITPTRRALEWLTRQVVRQLPTPEINNAPARVGVPEEDQGSSHINTNEVTCAICLDNVKDMTSTKCGHVVRFLWGAFLGVGEGGRPAIFSVDGMGSQFCNECIRGAIKAQKKCPTCRKKLSMRDIFRIYIS